MADRTYIRVPLNTGIQEIEGKVVVFTNANTPTTPVAAPGFRRRSLLGMMVVVAAAPLTAQALADTAPADAVATIRQFNGALLAAMKSAGRTDFKHRFQALAPAVDQAFDLPSVLAVSVGPVGQAFRRINRAD